MIFRRLLRQISLILLLPDSVGLKLYCLRILGDFLVFLLLFLVEKKRVVR